MTQCCSWNYESHCNSIDSFKTLHQKCKYFYVAVNLEFITCKSIFLCSCEFRIYNVQVYIFYVAVNMNLLRASLHFYVATNVNLLRASLYFM